MDWKMVGGGESKRRKETILNSMPVKNSHVEYNLVLG
jgi:hypothetical protein